MEGGQAKPQKDQKLRYFGMCPEGNRVWFLLKTPSQTPMFFTNVKL